MTQSAIITDDILYRTPKINSSDAEERRLARWAVSMKRLHKKGRLEQHKVDALNATEGWTWNIIEFDISRP